MHHEAVVCSDPAQALESLDTFVRPRRGPSRVESERLKTNPGNIAAHKHHPRPLRCVVVIVGAASAARGRRNDARVINPIVRMNKCDEAGQHAVRRDECLGVALGPWWHRARTRIGYLFSILEYFFKNDIDLLDFICICFPASNARLTGD